MPWLDLLELINRIQAVKSSGRQGIKCLVPEKWLKAGDNIQVCPNLEAIAQRLEGLAEVLVQLTYYLAIVPSSSFKQMPPGQATKRLDQLR